MSSLLDEAGGEGGFGLGGDEAVEGELAAVVGAEFEEDAGAVAGVGVNDVDGAIPGDAVEVAGVGDGVEGDLELAGGQALGDEGDVDRAAGGYGGLRRVGEGGQAAVGELVAVELLVR